MSEYPLPRPDECVGSMMDTVGVTSWYGPYELEPLWACGVAGLPSMVEVLACENCLWLPGWLEVGVTSLVDGEVTDTTPGPDIDGAAEARGSLSLLPLLEDPLSSSVSLILASALILHTK